MLWSTLWKWYAMNDTQYWIFSVAPLCPLWSLLLPVLGSKRLAFVGWISRWLCLLDCYQWWAEAYWRGGDESKVGYWFIFCAPSQPGHCRQAISSSEVAGGPLYLSSSIPFPLFPSLFSYCNLSFIPLGLELMENASQLDPWYSIVFVVS